MICLETNCTPTRLLCLDKYEIQMRSISTWKWGNVVPWWWEEQNFTIIRSGRVRGKEGREIWAPWEWEIIMIVVVALELQSGDYDDDDLRGSDDGGGNRFLHGLSGAVVLYDYFCSIEGIACGGTKNMTQWHLVSLSSKKT